jgi:hypothetical protein
VSKSPREVSTTLFTTMFTEVGPTLPVASTCWASSSTSRVVAETLRVKLVFESWGGLTRRFWISAKGIVPPPPLSTVKL